MLDIVLREEWSRVIWTVCIESEVQSFETNMKRTRIVGRVLVRVLVKVKVVGVVVFIAVVIRT